MIERWKKIIDGAEIEDELHKVNGNKKMRFELNLLVPELSHSLIVPLRVDDVKEVVFCQMFSFIRQF